MSNMDFFIFDIDQAQIKSAWFFLQNNLRLRNASRIQEGKQCKTEKNKKNGLPCERYGLLARKYCSKKEIPCWLACFKRHK